VDALSGFAAADSSAGGADEHDHHHSHTDSADDAYHNTDLSMINATAGELPDVDMTDISSGDTVNLRSLAGAGKPLLFWFWAPH